MRDCTCVGSCRGAKGLGVGWNCVVDNGSVEDTDEQRAAARLRRGVPPPPPPAVFDWKDTAHARPIAVATELLDALRALIQAAVTVNDGCAICGGDLDGLPPHYDGCAVYEAMVALAKAEGQTLASNVTLSADEAAALKEQWTKQNGLTR